MRKIMSLFGKNTAIPSENTSLLSTPPSPTHPINTPIIHWDDIMRLIHWGNFLRILWSVPGWINTFVEGGASGMALVLLFLHTLTGQSDLDKPKPDTVIVYFLFAAFICLIALAKFRSFEFRKYFNSEREGTEEYIRLKNKMAELTQRTDGLHQWLILINHNTIPTTPTPDRLTAHLLSSAQVHLNEPKNKTLLLKNLEPQKIETVTIEGKLPELKMIHIEFDALKEEILSFRDELTLKIAQYHPWPMRLHITRLVLWSLMCLMVFANGVMNAFTFNNLTFRHWIHNPLLLSYLKIGLSLICGLGEWFNCLLIECRAVSKMLRLSYFSTGTNMDKMEREELPNLVNMSFKLESFLKATMQLLTLKTQAQNQLQLLYEQNLLDQLTPAFNLTPTSPRY
ncbi:MAG: hypothetical protein A3F41_06215 [Coxiella sp. RIFCSPHIGHO2_12_FULL_44_14]|nr:MAG: hypothetical protein A3F41_06215 [Coxiella sp. RIFCSPHIGHO2_12_FULL_44_14]